MIDVLMYVMLAWMFIKFNWVALRMMIIAVVVVMFVANPVKKEVDSRHYIEARSKKEAGKEALPDKVVRYRPTYQERQNQNRTQLETKSEEMKNGNTK